MRTPMWPNDHAFDSNDCTTRVLLCVHCSCYHIKCISCSDRCQSSGMATEDRESQLLLHMKWHQPMEHTPTQARQPVRTVKAKS